MPRILVGTSEGLHRLEDGRPTEVEHVGWDDDAGGVTALGRAGDDVWALVGRRSIWRTAAGGWAQVAQVGNLALECLADTRAGLVVGTSEAHLLRVVEGSTPVETVESFERVEGRDGWYTPWGGPPATRSISEDGGAVYVNVHVGGIVRSRDEGGTWAPTIDVDADVHRVWAGEPGVFAACALGLATSADGGDTWTIEDEGLHSTYCRGVAVSGEHLLVSASAGPRGGRAAIYRRPLEGGPLERCRLGLPEWFDGNVDSAWLDATQELAAFATDDGRVYASGDGGGSWDEVASGLPRVACLLVLP